MNGAPRPIRTADLLVRSQTLYPAELWAHSGARFNSPNVPNPISLPQPRPSAKICSSPMTERLYYTDAYLRDFTASIVDQSSDGLTVYLDRTAFYPTSGGQPFDIGSIGGAAVVGVVDEEDRVAHRVASPLPAGPVDCAIDWRRRYDHMQQHTGQHLISAVFEELFGLRTVSFHLGAESAIIDVEGAPVDGRTLVEVERRANEIVYENRPVNVRFENA